MNNTRPGERLVLLGAFIHIVISVTLIALYLLTISDETAVSPVDIELMTRFISLAIAIIGYIMIYRGSDMACKVCSLILSIGIIRVIISLLGGFQLMLAVSLITSLINIYILIFSTDVKSMIQCKVDVSKTDGLQ